MTIYIAFHRKTKTDPFWMVTPVPKRGAESWIICGCFCDN